MVMPCVSLAGLPSIPESAVPAVILPTPRVVSGMPVWVWVGRSLWLAAAGAWALLSKTGFVGAHLVLRSFALVVGHVEVTKHLLSATLAPMSQKYCLDRSMPLTIREACPRRLA